MVEKPWKPSGSRALIRASFSLGSLSLAKAFWGVDDHRGPNAAFNGSKSGRDRVQAESYDALLEDALKECNPELDPGIMNARQAFGICKCNTGDNIMVNVRRAIADAVAISFHICLSFVEKRITQHFLSSHICDDQG